MVIAVELDHGITALGAAHSNVVLINIFEGVNDGTQTKNLASGCTILKVYSCIENGTGSNVDRFVFSLAVIVQNTVFRLVPALNPNDVGVVLVGKLTGELGIIRKDGNDAVIVIIESDRKIFGLVKEYGNYAVLVLGLEFLCGGHDCIRLEISSDLNVNSRLLSGEGKLRESTVHISTGTSVVQVVFHCVIIDGNLSALIALAYRYLVIIVTSYLLGVLGENNQTVLAQIFFLCKHVGLFILESKVAGSAGHYILDI